MDLVGFVRRNIESVERPSLSRAVCGEVFDNRFRKRVIEFAAYRLPRFERLTARFG